MLNSKRSRLNFGAKVGESKFRFGIKLNAMKLTECTMGLKQDGVINLVTMTSLKSTLTRCMSILYTVIFATINTRLKQRENVQQ